MEALAKTVGLLWEKKPSAQQLRVEWLLIFVLGCVKLTLKKKKTYPENVLIRAVLMKFSGINECAVCSTVLLAYESLGVCSEVGFAYKERVMTLLCVLKGIKKCCLLK